MDAFDEWDEQRRALVRLEDEMSAAAAEAHVRLGVARAWFQSADGDLSELRRPTWGGPVVDGWFRARDAVQDAAESVAAFRAFEL